MKNDDYWFEHKSIGYGSGLPIAWQGWAVLVSYIGIMTLGALLVEWDDEVGLPAGVAIMVLSTIGFLAIARAKTRGGWRWRWRRKD